MSQQVQFYAFESFFVWFFDTISRIIFSTRAPRRRQLIFVRDRLLRCTFYIERTLKFLKAQKLHKIRFSTSLLLFYVKTSNFIATCLFSFRGNFTLNIKLLFHPELNIKRHFSDAYKYLSSSLKKILFFHHNFRRFHRMNFRRFYSYRSK